MKLTLLILGVIVWALLVVAAVIGVRNLNKEDG